MRVAHVYDGDTVKLEDGRRLRIIGINTPETGHHDQQTQPYADTAKSFLQSLLATHKPVLLLQAGREDHDHYGRLLAHAFLENGDSLAVRMLQEGLATTLVVPPNSRAHRCYQRHEDKARRAGRGLWGLAAYRAQASQSLPGTSRGFHIIQGKVQEVRHSRHNTWVNVEGSLHIRINRKDSGHFESGYLENLEGQLIETRGWLRPVQNGLQMKVRHPAALTRLSHARNTPQTTGD